MAAADASSEGTLRRAFQYYHAHTALRASAALRDAPDLLRGFGPVSACARHPLLSWAVRQWLAPLWLRPRLLARVWPDLRVLSAVLQDDRLPDLSDPHLSATRAPRIEYLPPESPSPT